MVLINKTKNKQQQQHQNFTEVASFAKGDK